MKRISTAFFVLTSLFASPLLAQDHMFPGFSSEEPILLLDQEPAPLNMAEVCDQIDYPELAVQAEIEGMVQVWVEVDAQGNYRRHEVLHSTHELLSRALRPHVKHLRFTPAMHRGKPVVGWRVLPFRFKLSPFSAPQKPRSAIMPLPRLGEALELARG